MHKFPPVLHLHYLLTLKQSTKTSKKQNEVPLRGSFLDGRYSIQRATERCEGERERVQRQGISKCQEELKIVFFPCAMQYLSPFSIFKSLHVLKIDSPWFFFFMTKL